VETSRERVQRAHKDTTVMQQIYNSQKPVLPGLIQTLVLHLTVTALLAQQAGSAHHQVQHQLLAQLVSSQRLAQLPVQPVERVWTVLRMEPPSTAHQASTVQVA